MGWTTNTRTITSRPAFSDEAMHAGLSVDGHSDSGRQWQARQLVITPELLGLRNAAECQERARKFGYTPLPQLPFRQEYWRLDVLLAWSRANGLERLPALGQLSPHARVDRPFRIRAR
jgi:hypothetical protein